LCCIWWIWFRILSKNWFSFGGCDLGFSAKVSLHLADF